MATRYGYRQCVPLLVLSLLLGCGKTASEIDSPAPSSAFTLRPATDTPDPPIDRSIPVNLGVIASSSDAFTKAVTAGVNEAAAELKVELVNLQSPDSGSIDQQNKLCMEMTREDADIMGIAVSPIDPHGQIETVNQLNEASETITFGTDSPSSQRQIHVGVDDYQLGRECAQLLASVSPDGGKVVLIADRLEGGSESMRRQGLIDALLGRDRSAALYRSNDDAWEPVGEPIAGEKYSIVATLVDDEDGASASEQLTELVKKQGDIVATIALCGRCVPESLEATEGMKWIGLGYDAGLFEALQQGRCHAAIMADPHALGKKVIEVLFNLIQLQRSKLPKDGFAITPSVQVTRDNLDSLVSQWESAAETQ